jgi:ELWxxDGT repeat protein
MKRLFALLFLILSISAVAQNISLVTDINPTGGSLPERLLPVDDKIFFVANDGVAGEELWVADGTTSHLVKDIQPGIAGSRIGWMGWLNGKLYLNADDGINGGELWVTDGTEAGTSLFADIEPGFLGSEPSNFSFYNNHLVFVVTVNSTYQIWISDGTTAGTHTLSSQISVPASATKPFVFAEYNGKLVFGVGNQLWSSDGTAAGTAPFYSSLFVSSMMEWNGKLYLGAQDAAHGSELWVSDGTAAGTTLFKELRAGTPGSDPQWFFPAGNILYFKAFNNNKYSLWKTDGTVAGTQIVSPNAFYPTWMASFNGKVYFQAEPTSNTIELWRTDGTDAGTFSVSTAIPDITPIGLTALGNKLYFIGDGAYGEQLYSMGTDEQISLEMEPFVSGLGATNCLASTRDLTAFDGALYYGATYDATVRQELYKYTPAATTDISELVLSAIRIYPNPVTGSELHVMSSLPEMATFSLMDLTGKILQEEPFDMQTQDASLSILPDILNGMYIVRIQTEEGIHVKKLFIHR